MRFLIGSRDFWGSLVFLTVSTSPTVLEHSWDPCSLKNILRVCLFSCFLDNHFFLSSTHSFLSAHCFSCLSFLTDIYILFRYTQLFTIDWPWLVTLLPEPPKFWDYRPAYHSQKHLHFLKNECSALGISAIQDATRQSQVWGQLWTVKWDPV